MKRGKPVHHPVRDGVNRPGVVFLTVCTKNRIPVLARNDGHELIVSTWKTCTGWEVGRYVVMPDHLHLFCAPSAGDESPRLESWVNYWKSMVTRNWPRPEEKGFWQRDHWDRQLRSGESYAEKWEYVFQNPVRHGLVENAEDWPYAGEITEIHW